MNSDDRFLLSILGGFGLLFALLIGFMFWSSADFAKHCLEAGGTLVTSSVCLPR